MDLAAVMDEIAARVKAADPDPLMVRAHEWPKPSVLPPCFVVGYPAEIQMDATYGRGADRAQFPCWAVFGSADELSVRNTLSPFITALKARLDGESTVWQSARVQTVQIETINAGEEGAEYLAAKLMIDILT